jgi:hypothetical protein
MDDLPPLYNYNKARYEIRDVIGDFERDPVTGEALIRNKGKGQLTDRKGRPVNKRGYLVDKAGNVVDRHGK